MAIRVDCHTHWVQPEHFTSAANAQWTIGKSAGTWPKNSRQEFAAAMTAAGVDVSIVFGISAPNGGLHVPNDEVAAFVAEEPTRRIGFLAIDPMIDGALAEVERGVHELGLKGIKLYPVLAGFDPSDKRLGPFYALAERLGLPMLWHMGSTPVASGRLRLSHPLLLDDVAVEFPKLKMIIAHLGQPWQREAAIVVRKNPNVFTDVSGLWHRQWQGYEAMIVCQEWGITDKLLFGSDYPLWTPAEAVAGLWTLNDQIEGSRNPRVADEVITAMLERDTLALLGLDR
jgi:predicted TIM-barrel fold metal-dependent hydrolase